MGWKAVVVACAVIVAALGGVGWAVVASATPPSPVIGRPLVVTPAARELPTESPAPPAVTSSPSSTPSRAPRPSTTSPAEPVPSVTHSDDEESPEVVAPRRVRPVEDDEDEGRPGGYEYRDDDGLEADDD